MENQVQKKNVHYCAFISYRHVSPDQEIAARLHRLIERYTVPKALRGPEGQRHPGRVFRDQEELPLSADLGKDIETALDNSDYLICICTPRYLESRWCMREVDYFIAKHGRERVLTLLAEGEPEDSFPEQLLYETLPDGTRTETEPLAADVRGESIREHLKKLNREKLRILAPMLNTTFDGLYQRARRRRMRNGLIIAMSALVLAGGFLAYALVQNRKLAEQRETAARNEMDLLVEKSLSRTAENRKKEARELALMRVEEPGTCEHETGMCVDVSSEEGDNESANEVWKWMDENCSNYGFIKRYPYDKSSITGIKGEPWHYRYVGAEAAQEIMKKGITLEEYLGAVSR